MTGKYDNDVLQSMAQEVMQAVHARDDRANDLVLAVAVKTGLTVSEVVDQIQQLARGVHPEQCA